MTTTETPAPPAPLGADPVEQRRCAFLDGLRAMTRFLERHPEVLSDYPRLNVHAHHEGAVAFLIAENTLGSERDDTISDSFALSRRDFGGEVHFWVQTPRTHLTISPQRVAETLGADL